MPASTPTLRAASCAVRSRECPREHSPALVINASLHGPDAGTGSKSGCEEASCRSYTRCGADERERAGTRAGAIITTGIGTFVAALACLAHPLSLVPCPSTRAWAPALSSPTPSKQGKEKEPRT